MKRRHEDHEIDSFLDVGGHDGRSSGGSSDAAEEWKPKTPRLVVPYVFGAVLVLFFVVTQRFDSGGKAVPSSRPLAAAVVHSIESKEDEDLADGNGWVGSDDYYDDDLVGGKISDDNADDNDGLFFSDDYYDDDLHGAWSDDDVTMEDDDMVPMTDNNVTEEDAGEKAQTELTTKTEKSGDDASEMPHEVTEGDKDGEATADTHDEDWTPPGVKPETQVEPNSHKQLAREKIRAAQITNYRNKAALMINIHVTHHGGTTFCGEIGHCIGYPNCKAPHFACNGGDNWPKNNLALGKGRTDPWQGPEETATKATILRKHFHMVGWEYTTFPERGPLGNTDWESPNIVSVIIMRDPLTRLLSGGAYFKLHYGYTNTDHFKQKDWVSYSQSEQTDNYALRILTGNRGCCDGKDTDRKYLETAKDLLRRMTYVLDIDCLEEGMKRMAAELGITMRIIPKNADANHVHKSPKERIKYVYQDLKEKNHLDIELYEWSKSLALVDCASL